MPMYNLPEIKTAIDSFWRGLASHLKRQGLDDIPTHIEHGRNLADLWNDPNMLFSQCCGYDIVRGYSGKLRPVATPHYGASGCCGSDYSSYIVVSEVSEFVDVLDMFGTICVVNGFESHSGTNALKTLIAPVHKGGRFFADVKVSGAHISSLKMLQSGEAEVTCVDCVTYELLESYRPSALEGLRKLGRTYHAPAIPYVTRFGIDDDKFDRLQAAVFDAFTDTHLTTTRQALYLRGIEFLPASAYQRITEFEENAKRMGYSKLQ